jgi:hypothetical protein
MDKFAILINRTNGSVDVHSIHTSHRQAKLQLEIIEDEFSYTGEGLKIIRLTENNILTTNYGDLKWKH